MTYKLLAVDLDGTLLDDKKQLSERNIAALRAAAAKGVHIMIATGRPARASEWVFERAGLSGLVMSLGGSLVSDYPSGERVFEKTLPREIPLAIAKFCRERDIFWHCLSGSECYFEKICPESEFTENYFGYKGHLAVFDESLDVVLVKGNLVTRDAALTADIARGLAEALGGGAEVFVSDKQVIDITPRGVNKAVTLKAAAASLGVDMQEIIAFGDTPGDLPMIEAAGLGVCMANGTPETLAGADLTAPSNNDDGVAEIIEKYVLRPISDQR